MEGGTLPGFKGVGVGEPGDTLEGGKPARIREKYNLERGRLDCRCLIRRYKLCEHKNQQS